GVIWMDWRTPSSTTKSLPAPCIFVKFQIMTYGARWRWVSGVAVLCVAALLRALIRLGFPWRPCLEAPMHPIILRGVRFYPGFDQAVQPSGGLFQRLLAGKIGNGGQHVYVIAAGVDVEAADDGHDGGIPAFGDLCGGKQGCGGHA